MNFGIRTNTKRYVKKSSNPTIEAEPIPTNEPTNNIPPKKDTPNKITPIKNYRIIAKSNKNGNGGDIVISAGCGKKNGEIAMWTNGEKQAILKSTGDLVLLNGKFIDNTKTVNIQEITLNNKIIPDITIEYNLLTLIINELNLSKNNTITGTINGNLINQDSWLNVSSLTNLPVIVWFNNLQEGSVNYNIKCLEGTCRSIQLYIQIL